MFLPVFLSSMPNPAPSSFPRRVLGAFLALAALVAGAAEPSILTPPAPDTPRINGPSITGARPGSPFAYAIPATGVRPMTFSADGLPPGLVLDPATGRISGAVADRGDYAIVLHAANALGRADRRFVIRIGDAISLTPAMGWNSWNCWAEAVDQDKVMRSARAMVASGLSQHGWTYINIDDTWQGQRGGPLGAIQPDPRKFPDMAGLVARIHSLGLKAGIYSTPWTTSYATHAGGSTVDPNGLWSPPTPAELADRPRRMKMDIIPWGVGPRHFAREDALQWAAWGFDYLKYDWYPNDVPNVQEMADALRSSGRDVVYSLSNSAPLAGAADWARLANSWRTTGDIRDTWKSVSGIAAHQGPWAPFAGPGHWNDPDMLVVGWVGWGPRLHRTRLTADEQYTHIGLWCLFSSPLILGCDLERLDPFTLGLLTNDEVLALDQDPLGREAVRVAGGAESDVYSKPLADGTRAVGLVNRGESPAEVAAVWSELGLEGPLVVRDLWRQRDLGTFAGRFTAVVPPHGIVLVRLRPEGSPAP
jgi:alpha-galactosidase